MIKVNIDAAIKKANKLYQKSNPGYPSWEDLFEVLEALRQPVEQKTCEHDTRPSGACYPRQECEHEWTTVWNGAECIRLDCQKCGQSKPNKPKQEDLTLAEKFEQLCLEMKYVRLSKDCTINLTKIAESHYAPIIEASYHDGYFMGQKNVCPKDLAKAKEEGRKEMWDKIVSENLKMKPNSYTL